MNENLYNQYNTDRLPVENKPAKGLELPLDNTTVMYNGDTITVTSNVRIPYGVAGTPEQAFTFTYKQSEPK